MEFSEYQKETHKTFVSTADPFKVVLARMALGVAGEAGEIAEKVKKFLRGDDCPTLRADIAKELGDVLWYVSELSNLLELNLDEVAKANLTKLQDRKKRGVLRGSGDKR